MDGLFRTDEASMIAAHKAGRAYWRANRPTDATRESLAMHARSCGWHGEDNQAWLAGYYGEQKRDVTADTINDIANDLRERVAKIESRPPSTQNHYGDYLKLIIFLSNGDKLTAGIIVAALLAAGANIAGVRAAHKIYQG